MLSLIPIFFISEMPEKSIPPLIVAESNISFAFAIDQQRSKEIKSLLRNLYAIEPVDFCIALDISGNWASPGTSLFDQLIDELISISFHQKYTFRRPGYPFFFIKTNPEHLAVHSAVIDARFRRHGYAGIDLLAYDMPHSEAIQQSINNARFLPSATNIADDYFQLMQNEIMPEETLLIALNGESISGALESLRGANIKFMESHGPLFRAIQAGQHLSERYRNACRNNALLREKLDSGSQYYASSSSPEFIYKQKILEISKFYDNEYEILPLWYKRFGHIIKVLMGKRTFRSLYDDNVKKYNT